jgi:hypothetical protein
MKWSAIAESLGNTGVMYFDRTFHTKRVPCCLIAIKQNGDIINLSFLLKKAGENYYIKFDTVFKKPL